jgi:glycosyltransferase involved in cell wall biosynthesis/predicted metal-dependent phosphoesterase TrpH
VALLTEEVRMLSRCDLHCHTKYSDRPSEWLLRRLGAAESYTDPLTLYRTCVARGMDFVTISDHNEIRGALEIAHLPNTFVSNEVTTYFPEDGCKIHCLVFGIDEAQFADIEQLRSNLYELRDYLYDRQIAHAVAHPLFAVNDRLTVAHVEKLLVLFKRFEVINGSRDPRAGRLFEALLGHLDADFLAALATHHDLDPRDGEPWRKHLTGGSDDHSGLYLARAWTETPAARSVGELLAHLRHGACFPGGRHGSSVELAHSFYAITHAFYRHRLLRGGESDLVSELLERFLAHGQGRPVDREEPSAAEPAGVLGALRRLRDATLPFARRRGAKGASDRVLLEGMGNLLALEGGASPGAGDPPATAERVFVEAGRMAHELGWAAVRKLAKHLRRGRLTESVQTLASLGPVGLCVAPYLAAFHTQHKDAALLDSVRERFAAHLGNGEVARPRAKGRRAWVVDGLGEVHGVTTTVRAVAAAARRQGLPLTVLTARGAPPLDLGVDVVDFPPVGRLALPEYREQALAFPPLLDVVRWCETAGVGELVISTPGPLGLAALAAAKLLGIPTTGIYHTDFPLFVRHRTESEFLESVTWRYMTWFFGQLDRVLVPSEAYRQRLVDRGLASERLLAMPRGVDVTRFHPAKREADFWRQRGLRGERVLLYVGRVAREKNLEVLFAAHAELRAAGHSVGLAIVGDGPDRKPLARRYAGKHVSFTGFLGGEELARAYASADLFVFPSATDTFGNVVLEAQASGLPAVVSRHGGPQEIVARTGAGVAVDLERPGALVATLEALLRDDTLRAALRSLARRGAEAWGDGWATLLETLWTPGVAAGRTGGVGGRATRTPAEPVFLPGVHSF